MDIKLSKRFPILESAKIKLRQPVQADAEFIHFMRNDSRVNKFVQRPVTQNIEEAKLFIDQRHQDFFYKNGIYWCVELKTTGFTVGTVTLWNMNLEEKQAELGFELHPDFQKRGLMTEAANLVIDFGFKGLALEKLIAITSPENEPSIVLLEKLGFGRLSNDDMPEDDLEAGLIGFFKAIL